MIFMKNHFILTLSRLFTVDTNFQLYQLYQIEKVFFMLVYMVLILSYLCIYLCRKFFIDDKFSHS